MLNRYNQPNLVEGYIKMKKAAFTAFSQSGRRDSNPRPRPWQGRALPTELLPQFHGKNKNFFLSANRRR